MRKLLLSLFVLFCFSSLSHAARVVVFSTTPVNGVKFVIDYYPRIDPLRPTNYYERVDALVNPSTVAVSGVPVRYWKVVGRDTLQEMTQEEKDYFDQERTSNQTIDNRSYAKRYLDARDYDPVLMRGILAVLVDEINVLRTRLAYPALVLDDVRISVKNKIDTGLVDD